MLVVESNVNNLLNPQLNRFGKTRCDSRPKFQATTITLTFLRGGHLLGLKKTGCREGMAAA